MSTTWLSYKHQGVLLAPRCTLSCQREAFSQEVIVALKLITVGLAEAAAISEKRHRADGHCEHFSHAEMAALKATACGATRASIVNNSAVAICHCSDFSQALMAALKLYASGTGIEASRWSASCHSKPFSQALMQALMLILSGSILGSS